MKRETGADDGTRCATCEDCIQHGCRSCCGCARFIDYDKGRIGDKPAPVADGSFAQIERDGHFAEELTKLLNRYSQENASNTPDFILANYMIACLRAFNETSRAREIWYGRSLHV